MGTFKRYDGYVMHIPQEFIDSHLPVCPFCYSDNPHWLLDSRMEFSLAGSRTYYQCERCRATISSTAADAAAEKGKGFAINPAMAAMNAAQKGAKRQEVGVAYMRVDELGSVCIERNLIGQEFPITYFQERIQAAAYTPVAPPPPAPVAPAAQPQPIPTPVAIPVDEAPAAQPQPIPTPIPIPVNAAPAAQPQPIPTPIPIPVSNTPVAPAPVRPAANTKHLAILTLVFTVLAFLFQIINYAVIYQGRMELLSGTLSNQLIYWLIALILPVVGLVLSIGKNKGAAKALMIIAIVVLGIQVLSAIIVVVTILGGHPMNIFNRVNGSGLLLNMFNMLRGAPARAFMLPLLANLLFTAKNVLCMLTFIKMSKK